MESLFQDVRYAVRLLGKSPGFATAAILCIGLGIGATTAIFSIVNALLIRPFPGAEPERLTVIYATRPKLGVTRGSLAYLDYADIARQQRSFSALGASSGLSFTLSGDGEPERISGGAISASLFPMFGFTPLQGRMFLAEEDRPGAPDVILLSYALWKRRYGGAPIVGRSILVNEVPRTVVGVMPARFGFPGREEAWIPIAPRLHESPRATRNVNVLARLAPGVSWEKAGEELTRFASQLSQIDPKSHRGWDLAAQPVRNMVVGRRARQMSLIMLGAVVFVLLIACANVANLLLARATERQREMAVRGAFGAPRGRIVRQLLTESVLLALAGGVVGLAFAAWGIRAIESGIPDSEALPYWIEFTLDGRVLAFTAAVAVVTGLLFGLAPALQAARADLQGTLKQGGRGAGGSRNRLRSSLVVAEIALALVLLIGASLFIRSLVKLETDNGGFDPRPLLTMRVFMPGIRYDDEGARVRRVEDLLTRVAALPGVESAAASINIPLSGGGSEDPIEIDGQSFPRGEEPRITWAGASPGFAGTLAVRIERGRFLAPAEGFERRPVAVVNHTFASRFFHGRDPLGHRFRFVDVAGVPEWLTIVGVVADFKSDDLDEDIPAVAYLPVPFYASRNQGLIVRSRLPAARLARSVRDAVHASDPSLPVFDVRTMEKVRELGFWEFRLLSGIFGTFGLLALVLAAVGIYGVLSYSVGQRVRELGVRVALGAERGDVLGLVVRQGLRLAGIGIALGFLGSLAVTRVLGSYLYGISPTDAASFAGISLFLVAVAALASYLPARRATQVDPQSALRAE